MAESSRHLPVGTVTFLFTDIEGSTRLLQRLGDDYPSLLEAHASLMRSAIASAGGVEVSTEGDAFFVVFETAEAAVNAAASAQRSLAEHPWPEGAPIRVRIGIHTGVGRRGGDNYVGLDVHRAARVAAAAHGGQVVLTAETVDALGEGARLIDLGEHHLKDLVAPEHLHQMVIDGVRTEFPPLRTAPQLPEALRSLPVALDPRDSLFVGRAAETVKLKDWWRTSQSGTPTVGWIVGAGGIGKTRLAAELARAVFAAGVPVLYGSAQPSTSDPLVPLHRALSPLGLDADEFARVGSSLLESGRTLGIATARRFPGDGALIVLDDLEEAGSSLFEMVAGLVGGLDHLPVLILLLTRTQPDAGPLVGDTDSPQVVLGAISHGDAVRIAARYVGEADADLAAADIVTRSAGVPAVVHAEAAAWARQRTSAMLARDAAVAAGHRDQLEAARADLAAAISGMQGLDDLEQAHRRATMPDDDVCPYKGLTHFDGDDARFFFGREDLVRDLLIRFNETPILAVVGPSGSGKSSLVRAGLLPALQQGLLPGGGQWAPVTMVPDTDPEGALDLLLTPGTVATPTVLFVDQFERLFTASAEPERRVSFLDRLTGLADDPGFRVVISIRSDFYGEVGIAPAFARLLAEGSVLAGPMGLQDLQRAIELPARRVGLSLEPGLAATIAADVAEQPGALPLLSAALVELWERRRGRTLPALAYYQTGGVQGAVARLAEDAFGRLDPAAQEAARRILLRMAAPGSGGTFVARRMPVSEMASYGPAGRTALDLLVGRRLVTADGDSVQVAHEAVLRDWPRLRDWLDSNRQGRVLHAHLIEASQQWDRGGRHRADLYRGPRLAAALDWADESPDEINDLEREFVEAGRLESEHEAAAATRTNRRLRRFLVGLAVSLVVAAVAGSLALEARGRAERRALEANAARLGSDALLVESLDQSLLLAVEARRLDDSPATQGALLAAILRSPQALAIMRHEGVRLLDSALSPDGHLLATASNTGMVTLWGTAGHRLEGGLAAADSAVFWLGFPDDTSLVTFDWGEVPMLRVWDVGLRTELRRAPLDFEPRAHALDPLSRHVTMITDSDELAFFDPALGEIVAVEPLPVEGAELIAFSPDGRILVVGSLETGFLVRADGRDRIVAQPVAIPTAIATDGTLLAVADLDSLQVQVFDLQSMDPVAVFVGHTGTVLDLAFVPEAGLLVSASDDRTITVWDVATTRRLEILEGHTGRAFGLSVAVDGATLYSASLDGTAIAWDLSGRRHFGRSAARLEPGFGWPPEMAHGHTLVLAHPDGTLRFVDFRTGNIEVFDLDVGPVWHAVISADGTTGTAVGPESAEVFIFDPLDPEAEVRRLPVSDAPGVQSLNEDGRLLAVGMADHVEVWDLTRGGQVAALPIPFSTSGFNGTSNLFASGGETGEVTVLETEGWTEVTRFVVGASSPVFSIAFSPDGSKLATGTVDGRLRLWDPSTGEPLGPELVAHPGLVLSVRFTADGRRAVTSGSDGTIALWDVDRLQRIGTPLIGADNMWGWAWFLEGDDQVAAVFEDGSTKVWSIDPDQLEEHACRVANRVLSLSEWEQYLGNRTYSPSCLA